MTPMTAAPACAVDVVSNPPANRATCSNTTPHTLCENTAVQRSTTVYRGYVQTESVVATDGGALLHLHTTIRLDRPLDLQLTLGMLWRGRRDHTMLVGPGEVCRATRTPMGPATERLRTVGDSLDIEAWGSGAPWCIDHAPALVGESDSDTGFAPRDPVLAELHRRMPGLRIPRTEAVLEAMLPLIIEQKVTGVEARIAYAQLIDAFGEAAPGPLGLRLAPAAPILARTPYWALHPFGIERRRAETLSAAAMLGRRIEEAVAMPLDDARRRLQAVPGVGPWTAAEVALVALGDADAVSLGDYHNPHVVSWALAGEARGDDQRMLELLEPYRGHRGRVLRLLAAAGVGAPRFGPRMPLRSIASN
jgi:3-methyladenine DNA glycosylase/8-oxoguanine DNA glycosylase